MSLTPEQKINLLILAGCTPRQYAYHDIGRFGSYRIQSSDKAGAKQLMARYAEREGFAINDASVTGDYVDASWEPSYMEYLDDATLYRFLEEIKS